MLYRSTAWRHTRIPHLRHNAFLILVSTTVLNLINATILATSDGYYMYSQTCVWVPARLPYARGVSGLEAGHGSCTQRTTSHKCQENDRREIHLGHQCHNYKSDLQVGEVNFTVKKCEVFRTMLLAQTLFREFEINNHA